MEVELQGEKQTQVTELPSGNAKADGSKTSDLPSVISALKDKLTDVSKKNRSLRLATLNMRTHLDVGTLAQGKAADALLAKIFSGKKSRLVSLFTHDKAKMDLSYRLTQLQLEADFVEKETGNYDLYAGYPFAEGAFADGTYFKCPLVLLPVILEKDFRRLEFTLTPDPDRRPVLNRTFLIAFQKFNNIAFAQQVQEEIEEGGDPVEKALQTYAGLGIKFENRRALGENLQEFHQVRGKETSARMRGKIRLLNNAVMGLFPQTASTLLADYDALKRQAPKEGLLYDFFEKGEEGNPLDRLNDTDISIPAVTEIDDSQEEALAAAKILDGVVIHGPPGTGKSQVIVNLIAGAVAAGKSVLVVCEKRAALDVVHNRLVGIGLGDMAVVVHDHEKDRNAVFDKASRVLQDSTARKTPPKGGSDAGMQEALGQLLAYNKAMHGKLACGASLHELYSTDPLPKGPKLPTRGLEEALDAEGLRQLRLKLELTLPLALTNDSLQEKTPARRNLSEVSSGEWQELEEALDAAERIAPLLAGLCAGEAFARLALEKFAIRYPNTLKLEQDLHALTRGGITKFTDASYWKASRYLDGLTQRCGEGKKEKDATLKALAGQSAHAKTKATDSIESLKAYNAWMKSLGASLAALEKTFGEGATGDSFAKASCGKQFSGELDEIRAALKNRDGALTFDRHFKGLSTQERLAYDIAFPLVKSGYSPKKAADALTHSIYSKWIAAGEKKHAGDFLERAQQDRLSRHARSLAKSRKQSCRNGSLAAWIEGIQSMQYGARKDLQFQVDKPKHRWPMRRLVNEHTAAMMKVFPCWLASPATVSSIFPLQEGLFDFVVFDEASQCPIEHAVPAMHRAKQIAVAGDEKQLPPFDLFEAYWEQEEPGDEEDSRPKPVQDIAETESLLQLARKRYPEVLLKWHYRSRHEELIAFSNHAFYRGRIAHTPNACEASEPPIEWVRANGTWEHRKNRAEAERVVKLVEEIISGRNPPSVGVITFNSTQKELIMDLLERKARDDHSFYRNYRRERERMQAEEVQGLFVKNIENVQGDERDVIIFSIGYAASPTGQVVAQYGSLAAQGGENRLNVAISRAREKIYIVSSILPEDLPVNETSPAGPRLLKEYLRYSKFVSEGKGKDASAILHSLGRASGAIKTPPSPLVERLSAILAQGGLDVEAGIGASAHGVELAVIGIKKPRSYSLGIEFDSRAYANMRELKEWELHRPEFLESRGWKLARISSREYWQDPNAIPAFIRQEAKR